MFKIGDKVKFDKEEIIGYIVKMEIDPLEEYDYDLLKPELSIIYTVRVFKPFYLYGYADFKRMKGDIDYA